MIFLSIEEVIQIHDDLVSTYGGLHGIRDMGLLISAVEMPAAAIFGEYLHETIFDKAAAYLFHIVCNHAFLDGNKRTGAAVSMIFLKLNGYEIKYHMLDFENMVCKVAQGLLKSQKLESFSNAKVLKNLL